MFPDDGSPLRLISSTKPAMVIGENVTLFNSCKLPSLIRDERLRLSTPEQKCIGWPE